MKRVVYFKITLEGTMDMVALSDPRGRSPQEILEAGVEQIGNNVLRPAGVQLTGKWVDILGDITNQPVRFSPAVP